MGGYDFALVVQRYLEGHEHGDTVLKDAAVRWLRGEYATKTEAKKALGVTGIVTDANVYDTLKLLALFVKQTGYAGLVVSLDELVNLYKLGNGQSRRTNYEQILRILNDALQGTARYVAFLFGGTSDFLMDPRRGLYSYEALETRLRENAFAQDGLRDYRGPVLRLETLAPEDLYVLLQRIHALFTSERTTPLVDDLFLRAFLADCSRSLGAEYFRTPRSIAKRFVQLLDVLDQNPGIDSAQLLSRVPLASDHDPHASTAEGDSELAKYTL